MDWASWALLFLQSMHEFGMASCSGEEGIVSCAELLGRSAVDNSMNLNLTNVRTFFGLFSRTSGDI